METRLHAVERVPSEGRGKAAQFIPIRFVFFNKLTKDDKLLLAFDAFVLSTALGRAIVVGKIIHGDDRSRARESAADLQDRAPNEEAVPTTPALSRAQLQPKVTKVKTSALAGEVRKRLEKITALLSSPTPPDLVLNRHCAECEFQARCRKIALEKDDLSLLAGMSAKERQKLRSKGIFTVTQLSYTFRPRRRPKRMRDKREKYHHSLKALAIREKKIHIVGSPELKIEGTPVYLDVEGLPDRDFYYLIGLPIGNGESAVQHSLWADTIEDEGKIWRELLAILETIEKPVLIHYGSYETTFLRRMSEHNGLRDDSIAARVIRSTVNLLSFIFARIYFPTYSNRLKDTAGWFGFKWSESESSGTWAVCLRYQWEQYRSPAFRERIMNYNTEDCAVLDTLVTALISLLQQPAAYADVDSLDIPKTPATERGKELKRCFDNVLKSAHSDYEKRKISLRSTNTAEGTEADKPKSRKKALRRKLPARGGRRVRVPRKRTCQRHPDHPTLLKSARRESEHALLDVAFTNGGCKKVVVRYFGRRGYCPRCHSTYPPPGVKRILNQLFGSGFQTWAVYLRVTLRLSIRQIAKATEDLFGEEMTFQTILQFVRRSSEEHTATEELLLRGILCSSVIHIDETKMNILGFQQYVWVLTDGSHVVYRLTPGRETGFLQDLLNNYDGTVVTDFYGGYDGLPCRQQKCLAHLIRDLNDDLWKNPFDEEYERFVAAVRDLLVPIFEDVERFSLKVCHLRKHRPRVDRFYRIHIDDASPCQEVTAKY
ncbi:MAG: TM0106 family RecB-like putative nuclease [Verrucomicrobia bacterium]|nr:TM0106 family RecB-like putative nuclease [Verrucomicrobiota bacterium]